MWVTDLTNTLSKDELSNLNNKLKIYEDSTSNQLAGLMIPSLEGYPIEDLTYEIAEQNKIGTEKSDNGILLLIAKNDRKLRIEVGYGLEAVVPDALASSIIRNVIVPRLKTDNYYLAMLEGFNSIIAAIGGEYSADNANEEDSIFGTIFFIIMILIFLSLFFKSGKKGSGGVFRSGGFSGGNWSSGSSGSSWGGGGFSGGGGSFGGGGASGSW